MKTYGADFLSPAALQEFQLASLGENVLIHPSVILVGIENIHIGDHSRIDAHSIVIATAPVRIGSHVHIGAGCYLAGGGGIVIDDFAGLSQGVKVYSISDDYSGRSLTNPTVPANYKSVRQAPVHLGRHVIVGSGTVILPGVDIEEGCSVGGLSLVNCSTASWGVYAGIPARRIKDRSRDLLKMEMKFLRK